jgi:signal peptidase I
MFRRIAVACAVVGAAVLAFVGFFTNHSYVTTPSMYPTIPPGSMIFVSPASHYHVGEVIEFRANGLVWAHRLVEITPAGDFITKGDNPMNARDVFVPPVTQKDVIGVVTHSVRWIGFPELIAHRPAYGLAWLRAELGLPGRILLVGFVALASLALTAVADSRVLQHRQARHRRVSAPPAAAG